MSHSGLLNKLTVAGIGAVAAVSLFAVESNAANLGGYTFEPPPNPGSPNASGVASGLNFTPFQYVGTGPDNYPVGYDPTNPPQNNGGKSFSANGFSSDSTIDPTNSNADGYFTFGISANLSQLTSFNLTGLQFVTQPNGDASPTRIQIRSSLDNFGAALFDDALGGKNVWTPFSVPLALNNLTNITFRIYPYLRTSNNGTRNLDIDNVFVHGSTTPIPTPALLPGLVALGVGVLRKRKNATASEAEA